MKKTDLFPSTDERVRIEFRLFEITLLITIGVLFFWSLYGFFIGYSVAIQAMYVSGTILYTSFFIAYRLKVSFNILATLYYLLGFGMLAYSWLPSGGISGAIMHMFVLLYISGLLVLPLRAYLLFIASLITMVIVFVTIEVNNPDSAAIYVDKLSEVTDLSIASLIMLSIIGLALFIFKRAYTRDRNELNELIEELEHQKEKAEAADQAKTQFVATISHEMRTPLNGIVGIAELLSDTKLEPAQQELLNNLSYSSSILHSLISDVLDLTLIEDGKLILHDHEMQIKRELKEIGEILRPKLLDKKESVELIIEHDDNIPEILIGDVNRLRQVLINLMNNAIKFTQKGFVKVSNQVVSQSEQVFRIRFEIEDTGIGVSEENQSQLFNKFFRANNNMQIEGTGLGLSISKTIIELMEGEIGFLSEKGKGSKFYFEVPLRKRANDAPNNLSGELIGNRLAKLNVLVAEDVKVNQLVITKMLNNIGVFSIDIVGDGIEAVEKASSKHYDFIFMDVQMPGKTGIEAAQEILKAREGDHLPVIIAVTANAMKEDIEACKKAGMKDFISKPFTTEILSNIFSRYV